MFSQERSRDIYNGVLEKIADQATSSQKSLLIGEMTEIGTILNRNQAAIDKLKVSLEPQNSAKTTWQETRLSVRSIINDLRLVHKKIKGVLKLLD